MDGAKPSAFDSEEATLARTSPQRVCQTVDVASHSRTHLREREGLTIPQPPAIRESAEVRIPVEAVDRNEATWRDSARELLQVISGRVPAGVDLDKGRAGCVEKT